MVSQHVMHPKACIRRPDLHRCGVCWQLDAPLCLLEEDLCPAGRHRAVSSHASGVHWTQDCARAEAYLF